MEEKKKGGKRLGAGRKPVLHKKKQVSLYIEPVKFLPFGSEDKMKQHLYSFIDSFSKEEPKIEYSKATPESYNGKKVELTNDEQLIFSKPKIALKRTPAHWVELRRECADADEYAQWLDNLENDPYLTAKEKKEIKATV